jgi:DNA-binding MarR family transcriptional regulator
VSSIDNIWQQYLATGGEPTATAFGIWLIRNTPAMPAPPEQTGCTAAGRPAYPAAYEQMDNTVRSAILLARLERFLHHLNKPVFREAGISEDEFVVLATLLYMPRAAKTQLLRQCLIEIPTGSELLKRMKRSGLILEKAHPDDKRSVMITISARGRQYLLQAFRLLGGVEDALAVLTASEKETLLQLLDRLDRHHSLRHEIRQVSELMQGGPVA